MSSISRSSDGNHGYVSTQTKDVGSLALGEVFIKNSCDTLGWQIFLLYPKVTIIPPFLKSLQPQEELNRTSNRFCIDFGVKGDAGP